jgi:ElaB/YqjD/DUF883 family membrane-anchored ribosome-binding protein
MEKTSPQTFVKESSEQAAAKIEKASAGAHDMLDSATDTALTATQRMGAAGAELAESAGRWTEATRERVRRNPFASIGVAVGVAIGMVVGAGLFFRRGRWTDRHTHAH